MPCWILSHYRKTCITGGDGYYWDGSGCIKLCPTGQTLNLSNNQCECPDGTNWTGAFCRIPALLEEFITLLTNSVTPQMERDGMDLIVLELILVLEVNNETSFQLTCECPTGNWWNGTFCIRKRICVGEVSILDEATNQCICPAGTYLKNQYCQPTGCTGGQTWNGNACIWCIKVLIGMEAFAYFVSNGQVWNKIAKACLCEDNYVWNGNFC